MEVEYVKISDIKPAPYNPRKISDKQAQVLQESFKKIGFVVPVIINRKNNIIIAGHQRSNNAKKIGYDTIPAFYVPDISVGDEIRFNQMHNGVETKKANGIKVNTTGLEKEKFITIPCSAFNVNKECVQMTLAKEICKLIVKYGNVMSAVICRDTVVFAIEYVYACKMINAPVNAYICDDSKYEDIAHYFFEDYGVYSYENIKRDTFVQGLAQLNRSVVKKDGVKANQSSLYCEMVLPYLQANEQVKSILDFGCGKGAYITALKKKYIAYGLEFYNNNHKAIDITKGNEMIYALFDRVKEHGAFDCVVCDSVLNSVDSLQAEKSVMDCLNLFTSETAFISGRPQQAVERMRNYSKHKNALKNDVYYMDADGFTATFREGKWFFQKFHTEQQVRDIANQSGFDVVNMVFNTSTFRAQLKKVRQLSNEEYAAALDFEFDLPLPNGKRYGRNKEIKDIYGF